MYIKNLTLDEFKSFTDSFEIKSIYQTVEYGSVMNSNGYNAMYLGLIDEDKIIAASLVLIKNISKFKYAYAKGGYLLNYDDEKLIYTFTNLLKQYFGKLGITAIKISPLILKNIYDFSEQKIIKNPYYDNIYKSLIYNDYYHFGYNNFFEALKPRFEAIIDLNKPLENLFNNIKKEYKTKIRSASKNGIEVCVGDLNTLNYLYEFTKDKYIRNLNYYKDCYGYFNKSNMIDIYYTKLNTKIYLEEIQRKLSYFESKGNSLNNKIISNSFKNSKKLIDKKINNDKNIDEYRKKLIEATKLLSNKNEIITSVAIIIKQDRYVTILIDGYDENYKKLNSKHLLIWKLIEIYKSQGFKSLNLGGISNVTVDDSKYFGLNQFKLNFGAKMYEYAGDFELITNKINYNLYRNFMPITKIVRK